MTTVMSPDYWPGSGSPSQRLSGRTQPVNPRVKPPLITHPAPPKVEFNECTRTRRRDNPISNVAMTACHITGGAVRGITHQ